MNAEKRCFILGMVVAFSECVAGGCKRLALSPPLLPGEFDEIAEEACAIVEKHGLIWDRERNPELPEGQRWEWLLIAARRQTLETYRELRRQGFSPARSLEPFYGLLSYDPEQGVHTGYDAYRAYFPPDAAECYEIEHDHHKTCKTETNKGRTLDNMRLHRYN